MLRLVPVTDKCITFFLYLFPFILVMDVQAFERLLGPCMEILKRNIANYEEQLVALFGTNMDIADTSAWTKRWSNKISYENIAQ